MMTTESDRSPFRRALTWQRSGELFRGDVDETWAQGRASYGGLIAAAALGCMQTAVDPMRSVRNLLVNFVAPVAPGTVDCRVELLRAGKAATQVLARIEQQGALRVLFSAVFGEARPSTALVDAPAVPAMTPVDAVEDLPHVEGMTPSFVGHFRHRWGRGSLPYSGGESGDMGGYLRFADDVGAIDELVLLGLLDGWPAPVMSKMSTVANASTMAWTVDFLQPLPTTSADGWWTYLANTLVARAGYAVHEEWLWSPQGVAVARGTQVVAVFG